MLLLGRFMLLRLVVRLPAIIMLVMIAFLVQTAPADGKVALTDILFGNMSAVVAPGPVHGCIGLSRVRTIFASKGNAIFLITFRGLLERYVCLVPSTQMLVKRQRPCGPASRCGRQNC